MTGSTRLRPLVALAIFTVAMMGTGPRGLAAQGGTGAIEGRVTETENGRPVPGARLLVVGTTIGATTSETGAFRINAVPARQVDVRLRMIGFGPATKTVVVTAG